jgi:hypothetical protein
MNAGVKSVSERAAPNDGHGEANATGAGSGRKVRVVLLMEELANIGSGVEPGEFAFVVGPRNYCLLSVCAEALSPRVCEIRALDAMIDSLLVDADDSAFDDFVRLSQGEAVGAGLGSSIAFLPICVG